MVAKAGAYECFISQLVVRECQAGDKEAAAARLEVLAGLPLLEQSDEVEGLARALIDEVRLPSRAVGDALHIATAAAHGMDDSLTWNCTDIANATLADGSRQSAEMRVSNRRSSAHQKSYLRTNLMSEDDLLREVRMAREEYCRQFAYDLGAIVRDLREQERVGNRQVVCLPPRRPAKRTSEAAGKPA